MVLDKNCVFVKEQPLFLQKSITMNRIIPTVFACLLLAAAAQAQQPNPVKMLYQPRENFITFAGAGGGNLYNFFKAAGAASGILSLDGNIKLGRDTAVGKKLTQLQSLGLMLKVNTFNKTALDTFGNFDVRRLVFQDNDFRVSLGARYNMLRQKQENPDARLKSFASGFLDLVIVPYRLEQSAVGNRGMTSVSLNMGGKFGFLTKLGVGLFGINANPQVDMLFVAQKSGGTTLQEVLRLDQTISVATAYVGFGAKIEVPLNDFCLFFDMRKYFKMGSGAGIEGLSDRLVFSMGGMAIGSIFKNKDSKNDKKQGGGKKKQ